MRCSLPSHQTATIPLSGSSKGVLSVFTLYFRSALYAISGNEWDIDLSVIAGHFQIHCNTVPYFVNAIVSSNIASSQHIPFRNHFGESTLHSSFPKRFFRRLVERLKLLNMRFKISKMEFANRMLPSVASDTLYILQGTFKDLYVHLAIHCNIFDERYVGI